MLDLSGILFSSLMMLAVIVRALQRDRSDPWFQAVKRNAKPTGKPGSAWARRD